MTAGRAIDTAAHGVAWAKADPPGAEFAVIEFEQGRLRGGASLGSCDRPSGRGCCRRLSATRSQVTRRVQRVGESWTPTRPPTGCWSACRTTGRLQRGVARAQARRIRTPAPPKSDTLSDRSAAAHPSQMSGCASGDDHLQDIRRLQDVWHAPVAKVNDARAKRLRLDQLKVDAFVQGREVGRAAAE
jgi:hypothetical protein